MTSFGVNIDCGCIYSEMERYAKKVKRPANGREARTAFAERHING
jgi:hypothetical protein